jgi:uncharacterized protein (DUF2147 family)
MKKSTLAFAFICSLAMLSGLATKAQAADDILGTWNDTETPAAFSIYSCGGSVCAKIVKSRAPGEKDVNNPNPALRTRPAVGIVLLAGGKKVSDGKWRGSLYNPEDGNTYRGYLTLVSSNEVKLEGCVLGGLICKSRIWKRAR